MKVAIVYDRVNKWGGAERVLLSLHRIFPDAPLYTSVYDPSAASWADVFKIKTSFLQKIPIFRRRNEIVPFLMPLSFEAFDFSSFDLVISVTSESAKGIITLPKTLHICICLTPTRYLWSSYEEYFRNPTLRFFSKPVVSYLKKWDLISSQRPDHYIAISKEVRKRIKKYYNRDSDILYPPILIDSKGIKEQKGEFFLIVSRLSKFVSYKRIDLAVESFNKTGLPLKIVGTGSLLYDLQKKANKNIEFLGHVDDQELEKLYRSSKAVVFPGLEDFGLVMVEAQFFGKPVIAFRGGGALEIIKEGKTGEFFDEQTEESLSSLLKKFDERRYNVKAIKENAKSFSFENFRLGLLRLIEDYQNK